MIDKIGSEVGDVQDSAMGKLVNKHHTLRQMKDNCDFIRGVNQVIGQIREEKIFIDTSIEKVLNDLDSKEKENEELKKINTALEELNIAIDKEFKGVKSDFGKKTKLISQLESKSN